MMIMYYNRQLMISTNLFSIQNFHMVKHFSPQPLLMTLYFRGESVTNHVFTFNQMTLNLDQSSSIHTLQSSPIKTKASPIQKFQEFCIILANNPNLSPRRTFIVQTVWWRRLHQREKCWSVKIAFTSSAMTLEMRQKLNIISKVLLLEASIAEVSILY